MSILIIKPKDVEIPLHILKKSFEVTEDGAGFCAAVDEKLVIRKNFTNFDNFQKEFSEFQKAPAMIHFCEKDIKTEKKYFQPFRLDDNHAFCHTGITWRNRLNLENPEESQGANFARIIKRIWLPKFFKKDYLQLLIEGGLACDNQAAIMNNLGEVQIFNKTKGTNLHNCWLSESPYKSTIIPPPSKTHYNYPYNRTPSQFGCCSKCNANYTLDSLVNVGLVKYCKFCYKSHCKQTGEDANKIVKFTLPHLNKNFFLAGIITPIDAVDVFDLI